MLKASPGTPGRNRSIRALTELVDAIDRRAQRPRADGDVPPPAGSAELRTWACASIRVMQREHVEREREEMRTALAVMTDDGAPVRC